MLELSSPRWKELHDAYDYAAKIPEHVAPSWPEARPSRRHFAWSARAHLRHYAFVSGNVSVRDLADHTPAN